MCSTLPDFSQGIDKKWQDHPYILWKSARKGLILCNTGFIVAGPIICLYVEYRQVIEEFVNRLMVFRGEICIGRVSGRRRHPKSEVFQDLPYYFLVGDKADDLHFPATLWTAQWVCLIDLFDTIAPLF